MKSDIVLIQITGAALLFCLWVIAEDSYKAIPEDISFAQSVCKEGDWKSVDKSEVICKDGEIYKREEK